MEETLDNPAIAIEQDDKGYFIYPRESSFVAGVYLEPVEKQNDYLVMFSLKDGSLYAYYSNEFTLVNLMASLFAQENLSLGKWLNGYIKPMGKVFRVNPADSEKGTRVSDRFAEVAA